MVVGGLSTAVGASAIVAVVLGASNMVGLVGEVHEGEVVLVCMVGKGAVYEGEVVLVVMVGQEVSYVVGVVEGTSRLSSISTSRRVRLTEGRGAGSKTKRRSRRRKCIKTLLLYENVLAERHCSVQGSQERWGRVFLTTGWKTSAGEWDSERDCWGKAGVGWGGDCLCLRAILPTIKWIWGGGKRSETIFWQMMRKNRGFLTGRNICGGTGNNPRSGLSTGA